MAAPRVLVSQRSHSFVWVRCGSAVPKGHFYNQRSRFGSATARKASQFTHILSSRTVSTVHIEQRSQLPQLKNCILTVPRVQLSSLPTGHSMGCLVIKQVHNMLFRIVHVLLTDEHLSGLCARPSRPFFRYLAKRMGAIVSLGIPHRGSNMAQTLNNLLRASATISTRSYIPNLSFQNELLLLLNNSFRHYASDVSFYSFY